jgi:5-bromo-4-chloroindolyl phosphate hydrolysis protein
MFSQEPWFFVVVGVGVVLIGSVLIALLLKHILSLREERAKQERARDEREAREAEIAEMTRRADLYKTGDWRSASASIRELLEEERARKAMKDQDK